jgi:hypothetical protein
MKNVSIARFVIAISISVMVTYLVSCSCSKKTEDKQDMAECYRFADQHWIEDDYRDWLRDSLLITSGSDLDSFWNKEEQGWDWLSHHPPDKKDQQYYEMIGKYDQFMFGWDDYPEEGLTQERRNTYLECLGRVTKNSKPSPTRPE